LTLSALAADDSDLGLGSRLFSIHDLMASIILFTLLWRIYPFVRTSRYA
jgi:hypothetical protein